MNHRFQNIKSLEKPRSGSGSLNLGHLTIPIQCKCRSTVVPDQKLETVALCGKQFDDGLISSGDVICMTPGRIFRARGTLVPQHVSPNISNMSRMELMG